LRFKRPRQSVKGNKRWPANSTEEHHVNRLREWNYVTRVANLKKSHLSKVAFLLPDALQIRDTLRGELSSYPQSPSESFHRDNILID
jgi:hypothetical protein